MKAYQVTQFGEPIEPHVLPDPKPAEREVLIDVVSWLCRPQPLRPALSPTGRHVAARVPMVDVVNAGNTLRRNVINDSIAARLESLAASVDSDANVCPKTGSTHRYPTVQIDRGQHPG